MTGTENWKEIIYETRKLQEVPEEKWNDLIAAFPYFSNPYVLKAKALHDQSNIHFSESLSSAAARTLSRRILKRWIEGPINLEPSLGQEPETPAAEEVSIVFVSGETQELNDPDLSHKNQQESENSGISSVEIMEPVGTEESENQEARHLLPPSPVKNSFGFRFVKSTKKKSASREKSTEKSFDVQKLETGKPLKKKEQKDPIDLFLEKSPSISSPRIDFGKSEPQPDLSAPSTALNEEIITENMALIYLKQKNYSRALDIYKKLQLKFPEKSAYFAALIKNLENNIA